MYTSPSGTKSVYCSMSPQDIILWSIVVIFCINTPEVFILFLILIVTLTNKSKVFQKLSLHWQSITSIEQCQLMSLQPQLYTSKSCIFLYIYYFRPVSVDCLDFGGIFACILSQYFCLGFAYPSSCFTVAAQYLPGVRHINFKAFSFDQIMLFCTNYSNLVLHSFSQLLYAQIQHVYF